MGSRGLLTIQKDIVCGLWGFPKELRSMPKVLERINLVKEMRLNSSALGTRKLADRSHEFRETKNPSTYLIIPRVSSETRRYPNWFLNSDTYPNRLGNND